AVPPQLGAYDAEILDWLGAVLPVWDESVDEPSPGMRCRFVLSGRRPGLGSIHADLEKVFMEDRSLLALLGLRGVSEVTVGNVVWRLTRTNFGTNACFLTADAVQLDDANRPRKWAAFWRKDLPYT